MPVAVIDTQETHRKELKTLEGAYVVLRRLPYGEWLTRQEMALKFKIEGKKGDTSGEMAMVNRKVTEFEFQHCIVDHNLEDANGEKLDFRNPQALAMLHPKVGNEIGTYISELHEFEDELPNSQ